MEGTKIRPLDISDEFYLSLKNTFNYGVELFGILQALKYENLIYEEIELLPSRYLFPIGKASHILEIDEISNHNIL